MSLLTDALTSYREAMDICGERITLKRAGSTLASVRGRFDNNVPAVNELDGFKVREATVILLAEDLTASPPLREGDTLTAGSNLYVIQSFDDLKRRVSGTTVAFDVITYLGTLLSFTHPTTSQAVQIPAVYATGKNEADSMKLSVSVTRPRYRVRLSDLTALNLLPSALDGRTVSVDGVSYEVSSSSPLPAHVAGANELLLNLIVPRGA